MVRVVAAALAALPLVAAAQDASPPPARSEATPVGSAAAPAVPLRDGVYAGVGLGTSAIFATDQGLVAYRIRFGMTRSPRLQLGLELQHSEGDGSELDFTDVAATFFPWRKIFFVRGGFGFSSLVETEYRYTPVPVPATSGGNGINLLAGLGAQLGRSDGINLTFNVEVQDHRLRRLLSGDHVDEVTVSGWLGLEWH